MSSALLPQALDALILCRVIDNFGDVGVCWRLARQMATRGLRVALVLDDATPLRWMRGVDATSQSVSVLPWTLPDSAWTALGGQVQRLVIEGFGCTAPNALLAALPRPTPETPATTLLVNLEYLSAEGYVARSHGLASPQHHGAAAGLTRWFFYPGFTEDTGGLLGGWAAPEPPHSPPQALWFAYPHPRWRDWAQHLARFVRESASDPIDRVEIGLCPGDAQRQAKLSPGEQLTLPDSHSVLRALDYTDHDGFDTRLAASAISVVRGEDSFVRAQWAARPFVWHIYPQDDGAHWAKLDAWLDLLLDGQSNALAQPLRRVWHAFNDPGWAGDLPPWPDAALWHAACRAWQQRLADQTDLLTRLLAFAQTRRSTGQP
ncbi:elongation factor P maturation arginine rhamnosyltransferase EarP [Amphibiibacter pelophylacis]|uniref:Elongation factor P maturation arginine rhamnosyltransferase EarP n=1 Tax=Amphibiibacter pelophylacis TaxID=1799477 RepID=A0ACC6P5L1_9BURK